MCMHVCSSVGDSYIIPSDCENLLKKFLVLNPSKRASLEVCLLFVLDAICCYVHCCLLPGNHGGQMDEHRI